MNILTTENLSFAFGHVSLLDKASFLLDEHEKLGLIGRNGAGKSSLLKILAGVQKADDGIISIQNGLKTVYVAQESFFDEQATIFEVVSEGLGDIKDILRRYHAQSQAIAEDNSEEALLLLNQLQQELENHNGWSVDSEIKRTLGHLSLPENEVIGNLSGGQKKRVALAQALVQQPDILFLDEPTNHLDIDAIIWLENLLKQFNGSLIVITHDRRFLDNVATRIIELDRGVLRSYPGNFSKYSEKKQQELLVEAEHNRLFDKFHAQEEAWIRKGVEARRTRNEGRVKRLEQLRKERSSRREVQGKVQFNLAKAEKSGKIIAELEHVDFAYPDKEIIKDFSTIIQRGDKIALIGPNGIGKTTFLKLILGELNPTKGKIRLGSKQDVAYFDQFRSALNEQDTVFSTLGQGSDYVTIGGKSRHVMSYLEDFLFRPARAHSPVSSLSGGERNRLLLAKLFTKPANILILDEPTNDLDIDTQELLEDLLRDFAGTVFLVSHDRAFLDNVVTQSIVFEGDGVLKEYIGGYQDYIDTKAREISLNADLAPVKEIKSSSTTREKAKSKTKLSFNEQRELEMLPSVIEQLEAEQADLNEKLLDPTLFKDNYQQASLWQQRIEAIDIELLEKLDRWEYLDNLQQK